MDQVAGEVDATPKKRLLRSIIADYGLETGICELIDNAIDAWKRNNQTQTLQVKISIEDELKSLVIEDNAGGVPESELAYVVGPGQTVNTLEDDTIGLFGVGSKRAVVALAKDITITTRYGNEATFKLHFGHEWIEEEDSWALPKFRTDNISKSTTKIELKQLRVDTDAESVILLAKHLSEVYGQYIEKHGIKIFVFPYSDEPLAAALFDSWAFPPDYGPKDYEFRLGHPAEGNVDSIIRAGLTPHTNGGGEYGVYLYCNDRLVFKEKKDFSVGYGSGLAGQLHVSISPVRLVVNLRGPAGMMPWNSSKTDVNPAHRVFEQVQPHIVEILTGYSKVSRAFSGRLDRDVFSFTEGKIEKVDVPDINEPKKTHLPKPPASRPHYDTIIKRENSELTRKKSWTQGLYEGMIAAEVIYRKKDLVHKNRMALILLDSTIEIAFKEYILHEANHQMSDDNLKNLFSNRWAVHEKMKKLGPNMKKGTWTNLWRFYKMRCRLIHQSADLTVPDIQLSTFKELTIYVLKKLFKIKLEHISDAR